MSIPASGLTQSCRPQEYPQEPVTPPCDTTTTSCSDPRTGGPVRATNLPQTCENGPVMGQAERQDRYYTDSYSAAEDPSRTCSQRRLDQLLRGRSDDACMPTPGAVPGRPTLTVRELAEAQRGNIARLAAGHAVTELATHAGIEVGSHALAAMATRAGMLSVGVALPPLGMALGIVLTASSAMSLIGEAQHIDAADRAALSALAAQWETYQRNLDASTRSVIEGRMHALARGIEFVRNGSIDDPFVQRQIDSNPYIRLGVRTALEAQRRASSAPTNATSNAISSPAASICTHTGVRA